MGSLELATKGKESNAEKFFANNIVIQRLPDEEFFNIVRKQYPQNTPEDTIRRCKARHFDEAGKSIIIIRSSIFPEEYIPYVETHEKWEVYAGKKHGYNLFRRSAREFVEDKNIPTENLTDEEIDTINDLYADNIRRRNYDFRHQYAIYKEYMHAKEDGKLDEYHAWIMEVLKSEEKEATGADNLMKLEITRNDIMIRESVYRKINKKEGHGFLKY